MVKDGGLVLDDLDLIVEEYVGRLGHAGNPGIGRAFVKWAHDRRFDIACCRRVRLTRRSSDWRLFEEFPDHPGLAGFDADDQKFASVARVSRAPVTNAVDSDWWNYRVALNSSGIQIEFVCPEAAGPLNGGASTRVPSAGAGPDRRRPS
jgi:hypothetical protein